MLGIQNEREWAAFCTVVLRQPALGEDERFASNSRRVAHRDALRSIIDEVLGELPGAEVLARLDAAKIANASVNDMAGLWRHPQLAARNRWTEVQTPTGVIPALLPPGRPDARMDAVPALGEHSEAVLRELGLSGD